MRADSPTFYEFFAGGGMARLGLGPHWSCLLANDIDEVKARAYRTHFDGGDELKLGDVSALAPADLPGGADLAWASFPCQDLSLAGAGAGLDGARSGTFFPFWRLIQGLAAEARAPGVIVLENVCGTLSSHGGRGFAALCRAFDEAGYVAGALVIDAALFTPQSRPRLFVIGARPDVAGGLTAARPAGPFHTRPLIRAVERLPADLRERFVWWRLPPPTARTAVLADLIEARAKDGRWDSRAETERLLSLMAPAHRARVEAARRSGVPTVGALYRRTRGDGEGGKQQRAEVRFDGLAGCLRTPAGGSSRQAILIVDGPRVRSRLLTAREAARLMGLPESYRLPANYNAAYHLAGDGLVVPVVAHLARHLIEPLAAGGAARAHAA